MNSGYSPWLEEVRTQEVFTVVDSSYSAAIRVSISLMIGQQKGTSRPRRVENDLSAPPSVIAEMKEQGGEDLVNQQAEKIHEAEATTAEVVLS